MDISALLEDICGRIENGGDLTYGEALAIADRAPRPALYAAAERIRRRFLGNRVETCSIMNAKSGRCSEDCKWCAQSARYATGVEIYGLSGADAAVQRAAAARAQGVGRFALVCSGRKIPDSQTEELALIYERMRGIGIDLCGSFGLLSCAQLRRLKEAGMTRYHCNLETAPSFFPKLCSTHTMEEKLETLRAAKSLGYELCCGGIIGMGETRAQRVEFAFALRSVEPNSIPVNILQPVKGTPLGDAAPLSREEILTAYAIVRLANPRAHIRLAGGRRALGPRVPDALRAGASALLVGDMLTTVGSSVEDDFALLKSMNYRFLPEYGAGQKVE